LGKIRNLISFVGVAQLIVQLGAIDSDMLVEPIVDHDTDVIIKPILADVRNFLVLKIITLLHCWVVLMIHSHLKPTYVAIKLIDSFRLDE
jgi:hypothetical protein